MNDLTEINEHHCVLHTETVALLTEFCASLCLRIPVDNNCSALGSFYDDTDLLVTSVLLDIHTRPLFIFIAWTYPSSAIYAIYTIFTS